MSEIRLINKELGEIKIDDKGYFAIPDDIYNAIEQLQQENANLKRQLYSPDQIETVCPKCGEKFTTSYSKEVYDLKEEIERNKITIECYRKKFRETVKDNRDFVCKLNVYVEFEKWLEKYSHEVGIDEYVTIQFILDKLQNLKEGKK